MKARQERRLTIYRDDSTSQLSYERVKTWFWVAGNTVLVISLLDGPEGRRTTTSNGRAGGSAGSATSR